MEQPRQECGIGKHTVFSGKAWSPEESWGGSEEERDSSKDWSGRSGRDELE